MAITQAFKTPRGYELQPVRSFEHISEGIAPKIPKGQVATYLPVIQQDKKFDEWFVVMAGTVVSRDGDGYLIPCNGGNIVTPTYTANDIDYTVDIDGGDLNNTDGTLVAAAGAASTSIAANRPIGIAHYHWYSGSVRLRYKNWEQQPDVSILAKGFIEVPLVRTAQNSLDEGDLVMSDSSGYMVRWVHGSNDVSQIVGRVTWRDLLTAYPGVDAAAKVRAVRGSGVGGTAETTGLPGWLYNKSHQAGGYATYFLRINLALL